MNGTAALWFRITISTVDGKENYVSVVRAADFWQARMYGHELLKKMKQDTLLTGVKVETWDKMNAAGAV